MRLLKRGIVNQPNYGKYMSDSMVHIIIVRKTINFQLISEYPLKKKIDANNRFGVIYRYF